jgi:hypothetical protein
LHNFVPSSLKWTLPRGLFRDETRYPVPVPLGQTVGGHAEFARLNELQVLLEA